MQQWEWEWEWKGGIWREGCWGDHPFTPPAAPLHTLPTTCRPLRGVAPGKAARTAAVVVVAAGSGWCRWRGRWRLRR
jgi:hypothetical protein